MQINPETYYYERTAEGFELCLGGADIVSARSFQEMTNYVENSAAEFVEVNQYNWHQLSEEGAFDDHS